MKEHCVKLIGPVKIEIPIMIYIYFIFILALFIFRKEIAEFSLLALD